MDQPNSMAGMGWETDHQALDDPGQGCFTLVAEELVTAFWRGPLNSGKGEGMLTRGELP
jgi:hypothetical protein